MSTLTVCDVGPRDGLQNQPEPVSTEDKRTLIRALIGAGFRDVELTSFVNPKAVPQMADAEEVVSVLGRAIGGRSKAWWRAAHG